MSFRVLTGAVLLAALVTLSGCGRDASGSVQDDAGGAAAEKKKEETAVPVASAEVSLGSVYAAYSGSATLEAEREADVVAKTGGIIEALLVEEGDRVEAGQVVARLDDERLVLEVRRSAAALRRLEKEFERSSRLFERNLTSSDAHEKLRFDVDAQRAAHAVAELELSYTSVRAPIAGIVTERLVKEGNLVELHDPLFRVDDFDPLQAILYVPERELRELAVGQPATLFVDALGEVAYEGVVKRISPAVDAGTGTVKVTVDVRDDEGRLLPGMFARVGIVHDRHNDVVVVPREAIVTEDGQEFVFVLNDDRAKRVGVETGYRSEGKVEVRSGVETGRRVVTSGKNSIADGALVEVIDESA